MDTPQEAPFGFGYVPSPADYRDHVAAAAILPPAAVPLPATYMTDLTILGPHYMQAKVPACVSHSVALDLKRYWYRKTGKVINFSPRFLDTIVKRYDGLGDPADRAVAGAFPRLVFKMAVQFGCATEEVLPNDTSLPVLEYRDDSKLTDAVMADAAQYKIPGYIRVGTDPTSLRTGTYIHEALSVCLYIGQEWWVPSWNASDINPLRPPAQIVSGHQILFHGWKDGNLDTLANSWSDEWDEKGDADLDAVAWQPFIREAWAIAEVPTDVQDFLAQLPTAADFHYNWATDLHQGDNNTDVKFAQVAYMMLGYLKPIAPGEWGMFGPKTAAANATFQHDSGITPAVPGSIGPKTRAALNARFSL